MGLSRRELLGLAASAYALRDDTLRRVTSISRDSQPDPADEAYWAKFREAFYIHPELTVFNNVGVNPPPKRVEEALSRESKRAAPDPSFVMWRQQDQELDPVVHDLAEIVGCKPSELALVPNATYGLQTVISGLSMQRVRSGAPTSTGPDSTDAGSTDEGSIRPDTFVLGAEEYPRAFTACNQRARREQTVTVTLPEFDATVSDSTLIDHYRPHLNPRTGLIIMSETTYLSGRRLPVHAVNELAGPVGIPVLCDSAQSLGLLDAHAQTPMLVASLHKWMMGPVGTGILVIREPWIPNIWPLQPADENLDTSIGKFQQFGTHPKAPFLALKEAVELHHQLGASVKRARLLHLKDQIGMALAPNPKITLLSSMDPGISMPFLTIRVKHLGGSEVASRLLHGYKIHVTTATRAGLDGIRISPNLFTSPTEIQALVSALNKISNFG